jgi:hypothetical protein
MWRRLLLLCLLLGLAGCMEGNKPEPLKRVPTSDTPNGSKPAQP